MERCQDLAQWYDGRTSLNSGVSQLPFYQSVICYFPPVASALTLSDKNLICQVISKPDDDKIAKHEVPLVIMAFSRNPRLAHYTGFVISIEYTVVKVSQLTVLHDLSLHHHFYPFANS
jgi:hypothetical protein